MRRSSEERASEPRRNEPPHHTTPHRQILGLRYIQAHNQRDTAAQLAMGKARCLALPALLALGAHAQLDDSTAQCSQAMIALSGQVRSPSSPPSLCFRPAFLTDSGSSLRSSTQTAAPTLPTVWGDFLPRAALPAQRCGHSLSLSLALPASLRVSFCGCSLCVGVASVRHQLHRLHTGAVPLSNLSHHSLQHR